MFYFVYIKLIPKNVSLFVSRSVGRLVGRSVGRSVFLSFCLSSLGLSFSLSLSACPSVWLSVTQSVGIFLSVSLFVGRLVSWLLCLSVCRLSVVCLFVSLSFMYLSVYLPLCYNYIFSEVSELQLLKSAWQKPMVTCRLESILHISLASKVSNISS